jgi:hypothetical protein
LGLGTAASADLLGRLISRYAPRRMLAAALLLLAAGLAGSRLCRRFRYLVAASSVSARPEVESLASTPSYSTAIFQAGMPETVS